MLDTPLYRALVHSGPTADARAITPYSAPCTMPCSSAVACFDLSPDAAGTTSDCRPNSGSMAANTTQGLRCQASRAKHPYCNACAPMEISSRDFSCQDAMSE